MPARLTRGALGREGRRLDLSQRQHQVHGRDEHQHRDGEELDRRAPPFTVGTEARQSGQSHGPSSWMAWPLTSSTPLGPSRPITGSGALTSTRTNVAPETGTVVALKIGRAA